jgi:electron transfer flavoprotein alpha subunit
MPGDVLIIAEHWKGQVDGVTFQMLAKGRQLADALGTALGVLVLGHRLDAPIARLREKGMDQLWLLDHPAFDTAGGDLQAHAICECVQRIAPRIVLLGYTLVGMELAPAIAAKLGVPAMTNCLDAEIVDGELLVTRPMFDGTLHLKIVVEGGDGPAVIAVQKGTVSAVPLPAKSAAIQSITIDMAAIPVRSEVLQVIEDQPSDVDITKAEIIVSVGRGIGDKAKIALIDELAQAVGGLVACSRPLVDQGWLPHERQVGASGKSVTPKVYIACGISGASQHLAGMSESKMIVAINKDPNAPIFQVAHYGIVANLFDIVSALTAEARKVF